MADYRVALLELLRNLAEDEDTDFLRQGVKLVAHELMELEIAQETGAGRHQRTPERVNYRNGRRLRDWDTRVGTITLGIPKTRAGSYFPSFLKPYRRGEQALLSVVAEAYVQGVSTRKMDALIKSLGIEGISKDQVSRMCRDLDDLAQKFKQRPLDTRYPYLWLDATYLKVRCDGRVVNQALVVAIGVNETGKREVLGFEMGPSEDAAFWTAFLRSLVERGLTGVRLVTSDAHLGLQEAIRTVLPGTTWQRCKVHLIRNVLAYVLKSGHPAVVRMLQSIFSQPDLVAARRQLRLVVNELASRYPKAAAVLEQAEDDVLAYMTFPREHWSKISSTNPLERLNREIKRRSDVVGIFPNQAAVLRLIGTILVQQHEDWLVSRHYMSQSSLAELLTSKEVDPGDTAA